MNNETNIASGSISVWVRTSLLSRMTGFMFFGAKKGILSWDVDKKTVILNEVDNKNTTIGPIFTAGVLQVTSATFPPGKDFFISIDGKRYDVSLRGKYSNSVLMADAIEMLDDGVEGAYSEMNSQIAILRAFLKKENPNKIYVSQFTGRTSLGIGAVVIVVIAIIAAVIGFISNT